MSNSIKALNVALFCAGVVSAPGSAVAQGIAVHDSANLVQQINAVRQAIQIVAQGRAQIVEAQKLYQDLNKLTDIPSLAPELRSDALRELDTSASSLQGFATGNLDVVGQGRAKAEEVYRGLLERLGLAGSQQSRGIYDLNARNIGIQAALAESTGNAVTTRGQGIEVLRNRLATAITAKEVADLTARLFLTQVGDTIIAAISEDDEIGMAAVQVLAFYALGFFFFLQIPMLAASLGGGGPALANQFASAIAAAGGFVAARGASGTAATSRAVQRGVSRGINGIRNSGWVSRGTT